MSDRVKRRKAKEGGSSSMNPKQPMTGQQKKVVHWLRKNVPTKKTKFLSSHVVEYFTASKAVDGLLNDSPWAKEKQQADADKAAAAAQLVFCTREQCVKYLDDLLRHKMFHRAKKIPVNDEGKKKKKGGGGGDEPSGGGGKTEGEEAPQGTPKVSGKPDKDEDSKKKRKIRLDMHLEQVFVDCMDAYVWLYDPVSWYYWVGGSAIVLAAIGVCLFPLWPPMLRSGVHYLSLAAAGFLLLIMLIAVWKYVLFGLLYALSGGKLRFWLFPNLTEDVGFLESFMPLYDYTYTGKSFLRRRQKAKDSDDEEEDDDEDDDEEEEEGKGGGGVEGSVEDSVEGGGEKGGENSESDESVSKKSSTGKDFEIVDKNEDGSDANDS